MILDLKNDSGGEDMFDLVRNADAVVENFRPGVIDRLGVGFDAMRAVNPDVVLVSVSGSGLDSPYRDLPAYDLILQAMTGHMSIMGEPERPPVIMGIPIADLLARASSPRSARSLFQRHIESRRRLEPRATLHFGAWRSSM